MVVGSEHLESPLTQSTLNDMQSLEADSTSVHNLHASSPLPITNTGDTPIPDTFMLAENQPLSSAKPIGDDLLQDLDPLSRPGPTSPIPVPKQTPGVHAAREPESSILAELKQHEEDPRQWLDSTRQQQEEELPKLLREASSTFIDFPPKQPESPHPSNTPLDTISPPIPRTSSDTHLIRNQRHASPSPSSRPSATQSAFATSRSWMSSLGLLGSSRAAPTSPTPSSARGSHEHTPDPGGTGLSPTQSTLHSLFARAHPSSPTPGSRLGGHARYATDGHHPIHAATMPLPTPQIEPSPFAATPFIPPSGAPGFTGDRNWNREGFEFDVKKPGEAVGKGVTLVGRNSFTTPVLNEAIANSVRAILLLFSLCLFTIGQLRRFLPALSRLPSAWTLLYSADQHGLSLNTLYHNCTPDTIVGGGGVVSGSAGSTGTLLAVQDGDDGVFGAWIAEGMHLSHGSYYGGGDSFLWKVDKDASDGSGVNVFKWTGRNDYVALCDLDGFSFGGG